MKKQKIIQKLVIEGYASGGKGLGKVDGKIIFVTGTVEGDIIDVRLGRSRKNWMEGVVIHWHQYSAKRIHPLCKHFAACGGCKWQMLPYETQITIKQQEINGLVSHHSHWTTPATLQVIHAKDAFYYRNKMEFSFSPHIYHTAESDKDETLVKEVGALGLHVPGRFDKVLHVSQCHLMHPEHNHIRNTIYQIACSLGCSFYDVHTHSGLLRNLQIKRSEYSGEWLLWVIFGEAEEKSQHIFLEEVVRQLPEIQEIHYSTNTKLNDSLHDLIPKTFKGKGYIEEALEQLRFRIDPKSFFQTNTQQAQQLYQVVKTMAQPKNSDILYDLYCGMGSIGLFMADAVKKVVGVEIIPEAISAAKENSLLNGVHNTAWYLGKAEDIIRKDFVDTHGKADIVVLDPPRAGLHARLIETLLEMGAEKIIYVSCNPATQVRDIECLSSQYQVQKMIAVDMFPQTHHIESVALLTKK